MRGGGLENKNKKWSIITIKLSLYFISIYIISITTNDIVAVEDTDRLHGGEAVGPPVHSGGRRVTGRPNAVTVGGNCQ